MMLQRRKPLRDPGYLEYLKMQPCVIAGHRGTEYDAVDPAHIGTAGKGVKSGDDQALPILHSIHAEMHQHGEISILRKRAPNWLLREAFRALAKEMYREWKEGNGSGYGPWKG